MKVHHLNCGTMCPLGGRLVNGAGGVFERATMVCHCLLIETADGLVLVDSGLGTADVREPTRRLGREFSAMMGARLDLEETALRQVERLGFGADDVRHVVLTHLDLDHAGGISDFPAAKVHVLDREHDAALHKRTFLESRRYRSAQWAHDPTWVIHAVAGERWHEFDAVHALSGASSGEVLLVPLFGHSRGHCAVAVRSDDGWLLHCGDAYFHTDEMHPDAPHCTPALAAFQRIVAVDDAARVRNQGRLRALKREHGAELQLFCAHDPSELASALR